MANDPEETLNQIEKATKELPEKLASKWKDYWSPPKEDWKEFWVPDKWSEMTQGQKWESVRADQEIRAEKDREREEKRRMELTVPQALGGVGSAAVRTAGGLGLDLSPIVNVFQDFKQLFSSIKDLFYAIGNLGKVSGTVPDISYKGEPPPAATVMESLTLPGTAAATTTAHEPSKPATQPMYVPPGMTGPNVPSMTGAAFAGKSGSVFNNLPLGLSAVPQSLPLPSPPTSVTRRDKVDDLGTKLDAITREVDKGEGPGDVDESENVENVPPISSLENIKVETESYNATPPPRDMKGAEGPARPSIARGAMSAMLRAIPHPAARFASIFI